LGLWTTVLELVLASSFFPFFGYLILIFGRQYMKVLYYATKKGEINAELTSIAKKENPRISKVVIKDIDRMSAYVNSVANSIILTRRLLETLNHKETLAVLYHEIGHGGFYSLPIRIFRLVFIIPAFLILYLVSCSFVYGVTNFLLQFFWNPFSLVFAPSFLFCILNIIEERRIAWPWEYKADARASSKVGTEMMISALKKILSPEFESCDTPTHPSLKRRINHLRRIEKKAKKN
jgi:Zn-dependent protease with chaperone function